MSCSLAVSWPGSSFASVNFPPQVFPSEISLPSPFVFAPHPVMPCCSPPLPCLFLYASNTLLLCPQVRHSGSPFSSPPDTSPRWTPFYPLRLLVVSSAAALPPFPFHFPTSLLDRASVAFYQSGNCFPGEERRQDVRFICLLFVSAVKAYDTS